MAGKARVQLPSVVSASQVPALLALKPIVLSVQTQIDPTPSGFIEGAIGIDQDSWTLDSRSGAQLADLDQWRALIGALSIQTTSQVLVYDNGDLKFASRVRYLLGHFGVKQAALVNGGWPALQALAGAGKLQVQPGPSPSVFVHTKAKITQAPIPMATRREVAAVLSDPKVTLVDVRTPAEYNGTDVLPGITRPGHIPGALNLPLNQLFSSPTTLMDPPALQAAFAQSGIDGKTRLIFYCQDGARSSLGAAAARLAGFGKVELYYQSYLDWQADPQDPVAT
ncbi:MAG TPA: rhodanese-like domain-containing protein [Caulobacteraceae bacterium]|jgi:thiosulfate/3-mercaptopyruvate sulfurtransferase